MIYRSCGLVIDFLRFLNRHIPNPGKPELKKVFRIFSATKNTIFVVNVLKRIPEFNFLNVESFLNCAKIVAN